LFLNTGLIGVLVPSTVFKTACDLRARLAGFDSQAVPPLFLLSQGFPLIVFGDCVR
jgi:hypothetical protein